MNLSSNFHVVDVVKDSQREEETPLRGILGFIRNCIRQDFKIFVVLIVLSALIGVLSLTYDANNRGGVQSSIDAPSISKALEKFNSLSEAQQKELKKAFKNTRK